VRFDKSDKHTEIQKCK